MAHLLQSLAWGVGVAAALRVLMPIPANIKGAAARNIGLILAGLCAFAITALG